MNEKLDLILLNFHSKIETGSNLFHAHLKQSYGTPTMSPEDIKGCMVMLAMSYDDIQILVENLMELNRYQPVKKTLIQRLLRK